MTDTLIVIVAALAVIAAATLVGPRLGIASPLVLVAVGVGASFLPVFGTTHVPPELILQGVLPPLLYSSAVSIPAMNFRREFGTISGLSVLLVVGSAFALGLFFLLAIPGLGFAWGVALGAIVSPTDAVATSIIKERSASQRIVAILDGESLLNDATALVLLRTAVLAVGVAGTAFSVWEAIGRFAYSVVLAVVVGVLVGRLNLLVRRRVTDATVNTVISFAVPFVASVPVEILGGSGLVAAVVAGLITGIRGPRELSPQHRLSDSWNWRTVSLVLEGAVFLTMGVQLKSIVTDVENHHAGVGTAVLVAVGALVLVIVVRAVYVAPLLAVLHWRAGRTGRMEARLQDMQEKMDTPVGKKQAYAEVNRGPRRKASERDLDRFAKRVTQVLADIDYFLRKPLGRRDGAIVVWAGMRGAVTVAAAQTLPDDTPQRPVLVLVAFAVAALSLLVQGGTLGPALRIAQRTATTDDDDTSADDQQTRLLELLRRCSEGIAKPDRPDDLDRRAAVETEMTYRVTVLNAQRGALLDARDSGTFDADLLAVELANLDASQIAIEMRGQQAGRE